MRPSIKYDFSEFDRIAEAILHGTVSPTLLDNLKKEFNRFFKDSTCTECIYTQNDDKLFFGMYVYPNISGKDAVDILQGNNPKRIESYCIEMDSKLFNPAVGFSNKEIVALWLHEIGHLVNDSTPIENVRHAVDEYLAKTHDALKIVDSVHYQDLLAFGIKNTIHKIISCFECNNDEILADEFVFACGYAEYLQSAYDKIVKNSWNLNSEMSNKFITMSWCLQLYKDIEKQRIPAMKVLKRVQSISPSKIEKKEIENTLRRLNRIDEDYYNEAAGSNRYQCFNEGLSDLMRNARRNGIRNFEDDFYDYNMRINNVEDEEDALYLMRQINTRISIIEDYLATEKGIDDQDRKRWNQLYARFTALRDKLSKTTVYKVKSYGLYVNYPDIKPDRYM